MKKTLMLFIASLATIAMNAATITLMANGKVYDVVEIEVGQPLGYLGDASAEPFYSLEFVGWSTNQTGKPVFVDEGTIVDGDMTLYAQWKVEEKTRARYLKRLRDGDELGDGDKLYLITADGKHTMKFSTDDYTNISFSGRTGWVEHFGKQMDIDLPVGEGNIDISEDDDLGLYFEFLPVYGSSDNSYDLIGGYARTAFFAYQFPDEDEPVLCNVTHHGREDLAYLGYNFDWNLSFTADGFAKLENGEYGYIYYDEEASEKWGYNFRLSKSAQPNLLAYTYVEERDTVYVSSIAYNVITVVSDETQVMALIDRESGNAGVAMMWQDEEGNPLDNPTYAVMEGSTCILFAEYDKDMYRGEFTCTDTEVGKLQEYEVWGDMKEVFAVTPTKNCTVNFNLILAPKTIVIGNNEVTAAEGETDVFGDGSVIVDMGDIQLTEANLTGDIMSPYSNTWLKTSGSNSIKGNITVDSYMGFYCWDEEPAELNVVGNLSCTGAVANSENGQILNFSNVEVTIWNPITVNSNGFGKSKSTIVSAISGFEDIEFDEEEFAILQPLNGYYDTTRKMLVDADGNPADTFQLVTREHFLTGVNAHSASLKGTSAKQLKKGRIVITHNGRNYNAHGIEVK